MVTDQIQPLYVFGFLGGFIGYLALGPLPPPGQGVSRMGYFVRLGALMSGSTVAFGSAIDFFQVFGDPSNNAIAYPLTVMSIGLASGVYLAVVALGRSADSGGGRRFAVFGIVPFAIVGLGFTAPATDPARVPYRPRSSALRFTIGCSTFVGGILFAGTLMNYFEPGDTLAAEIDRQIALVSLPQRIDEITVLSAIRHDPAHMRVVYEHVVDLPTRYNASRINGRLGASVTPLVCGNGTALALLENGYVLEYVYNAGGVVGDFTFTRSECRWANAINMSRG